MNAGEIARLGNFPDNQERCAIEVQHDSRIGGLFGGGCDARHRKREFRAKK